MSEEAAPPPPSPPDDNQLKKTKKRRKKKNNSNNTRSTTITIHKPNWSYIHLELKSTAPTTASSSSLDVLTVRTYLTAALSQFLGLTGVAIPIDILKVERRECWIRVPTDDLAAVTAAAGGWVDGGQEVGWKVIGKGNWLGVLMGEEGERKVWEG